MLAAGAGEVGGLGARAIYGDRVLTLREFEEAWMVQQTMIRLGDPDKAEDARKTLKVRTAIDLEQQGFLDAVEANPDYARPDWIPRDPGPM